MTKTRCHDVTVTALEWAIRAMHCFGYFQSHRHYKQRNISCKQTAEWLPALYPLQLLRRPHTSTCRERSRDLIDAPVLHQMDKNKSTLTEISTTENIALAPESASAIPTSIIKARKFEKKIIQQPCRETGFAFKQAGGGLTSQTLRHDTESDGV